MHFPDNIQPIFARHVDVERDKGPGVTADLLKHIFSARRIADEERRKGLLKKLLEALSKDRMIVYDKSLFFVHPDEY